MSRGDINIKTLFGVETTPGTAVTANKKFAGVSVNFDPKLGTQFYGSESDKYQTVGVLNTNHSEGDFDGPLSFAELLYPLASMFGVASSVQIGVTGAYTHTVNAANSVADANTKTYTFVQGDASLAERIAHGRFKSLSISIDRQKATMKGKLCGRKMDNSVTQETVYTEVENRPVSMNDMTVYLESTGAALVTPTNKLSKVFDIQIDVPEKYDEVWVLDAAQDSYVDDVEQEIKATCKVTCEHNAANQAIYNAIAADNLPTRFLGLHAVGLNLGTSADETMQLNFALKLSGAAKKRKAGGKVYGYEFSFNIVNDATWGKPLQAILVNKIVAP